MVTLRSQRRLVTYGVRLGLSVLSSCTVKTLSNLEMPYTVMVPTIALCHSGVGAVVSPVSFYISPSFVCFCSFCLISV